MVQVAATYPIPEPGSWTMLIAGLLRYVCGGPSRLLSI